MAIQIQVRRDSAANWTTNNPIMAQGEWGFEYDTGKIKIGNGLTAWTALDYTGEGGTWGEIIGTLSDQTDLQTALDLKIDLTQKAANNGVATLDGGGKIPSSQLPSSVMEFKGTWDASTNTPTLIDGTGDNGDVYLVSVAGTQDLGSGSITFALGDWVVYNGTIWQKSLNSDAVVSVNSQTGVVVLDTDDISEGTNLYNQTHTGEVTGATTLTVDNTAISNKSTVTADNLDFVLIGDTSDTNNLKKALVRDFGSERLGDFSMIRTNSDTLTETLTIPSGTNGSTVGPITITGSVTVNGSWTVI